MEPAPSLLHTFHQLHILCGATTLTASSSESAVAPSPIPMDPTAPSLQIEPPSQTTVPTPPALDPGFSNGGGGRFYQRGGIATRGLQGSTACSSIWVWGGAPYALQLSNPLSHKTA